MADYACLSSLGTGASIAVKGRWQAAPIGAEQKYELQAEEVTLLGSASEARIAPAQISFGENIRTQLIEAVRLIQSKRNITPPSTSAQSHISVLERHRMLSWLG